MKSIKQVIKSCKHTIKYCEDRIASGEYDFMDEAMLDTNKIVLKALKKQIAKKPTSNGNCPECFSDNEYPYNEERVEYCPSCGQKIDWSED